MRSSIHVLACALLAATSGSAGQQPGYRQVVGEYRIDSPAAVRTIRTWPGPALAGAAEEPLTSTPVAWSIAELRAAAMLHTDAALQLVKSGREAESTVHLDAAARFVDASLERDATYTGFARRWYIVAAAMLEAHGAAGRAAALRIRAATSLPSDAGDRGAREAYERGLRLEIAGAVEGPLSPARRIGPPGQIDPRALQHFGAAALAYGKAATGEQFEASLHLGRVQMLRNADVEAARALTLAEVSADPRVKYLARLFLGAIEERASRFDRAEHWYRAARDAFPWGQSAPIALAELLSRVGDETGARAVLAESLARRHGRTVDPLWTYLVEPGDHLGPSLDELRAEIWQ